MPIVKICDFVTAFPAQIQTGEVVPIVKICDFGLSVALDKDGILDDKQGTWAYWAPEMFTSVGYGKQVDMWSLGIILYSMLCGALPFRMAVASK